MTHSIAVHGGAGTINPASMTHEKEAAYRKALAEAVLAGDAILAAGGSALDAVTAAVSCLEDCPLFNAGRGSVFTHEGIIEMDASVMEGRHGMAGAVAAVRNVKNPVLLAREVMEHSGHVLLTGRGAEEFARSRQIAFMPDEYFFTEFRWEQLQKAKAEGVVQLDHSDEKKFGTVGAVALDEQGNLAAATSTGGMTNKRFGRVGDTSIIGAGTIARNGVCAVSCTGSGEYFIRLGVAHEVSSLMRFAGLSLSQACERVVLHDLQSIGGDGGLVAVDAAGNVEMIFNCEGMYRASKQKGCELFTAIYK